MSTQSQHPAAVPRAAADPAQEVLRLTSLVEARGAELSSLQQELRDFKTRYAATVGSRLAELAELERAIKEAEARTLGVEHGEADEDEDARADARPPRAVKSSLKNLFWSVAKLFHPDHAADESEARRRHAIMAEASRAYRDGDVESLGALLDDAELRLYCATPRPTEDGAEIDLAARVVSLKEELLTVEFGIKRVRQDRLYRLKLEADRAAASGRDTLAEEAARLERKLAKTRNRLAHLS
ncbi:MAG: hypothetical protein LC746_04865 [Acidobacteria bacterium]|nr:hypothetical protein [Acidobacteriota bacterium]